MSSRRALAVAAFAVVLTLLYVNVFLNRFGAKLDREPLTSFPKTFTGWKGEDQAFPSEILEKLGVDEYIMRRFSDGKRSIWLYIGYYKNQRDGAVPHSPRLCYPGSGYNPLKNDVVAIPVDAPGRTEIRPNRYLFARGQEREVVIFWYQSRGRVVANEYLEKLHLLKDAIFRNRVDGALVRVSIGTRAGDEDAAIRTLESFVSLIYPQIPRVVPD